MGGLAVLARELGDTVSGSDTNVYPPMSTQLADLGIALREGYRAEHLEPAPDLVLVGNALSRGNPAVERMLDANMDYVSGPQWLAERVLRRRHVLAVAGTHGKTTTSSMLAWILECAGLAPGFLIGGVPMNFGISARLGGNRFFVVEADEYDTAFFDKRSKFVHYRPRTLVINNIEFDHADIFPDLAAIQRQFHHLVRTVPSVGRIIRPREDAAIDAVITQGVWTPIETLSDSDSRWTYATRTEDYSHFDVRLDDESVGEVHWTLIGRHNALNALAAISAAEHVGVAPRTACQALCGFLGVKRRLEQLPSANDISIYDDFAHHPTEIRASLAALRQRVGRQRIVAVFEPRSNTMRLGSHQDELADAFSAADMSVFYQAPGMKWDLAACTAALGTQRLVFDDLGDLVAHLADSLRAGDHCLIMSNGGFGGLHGKLIERLSTQCT
jgi:UDP-N-acetylmuramate: L-alanyl-gamma-D-glutamyl-meso-diaminopimelate ligase